MRKNSQSNRPRRGPQTILTSVDRTLRLRGLDSTETITNALETYRITGTLPPLPDFAIADG